MIFHTRGSDNSSGAPGAIILPGAFGLEKSERFSVRVYLITSGNINSFLFN